MTVARNREEGIGVDGKHYIINGNKYPRLTNVMKMIPKPWLDKWRENVGEEEADRIVRETAGDGDLIHLVTELIDTNQIDELNELLRGHTWLLPYRWAWQEYKDMYLDRVVWVETVVWSDEIKVAGRIDKLVVYKGDTSTSILDIKSTKMIAKSMGVQLRGYQKMTWERLQAAGAEEWMYPQRTVVAHLPGPREDDEEMGRYFDKVKVREFDPMKFDEVLMECVEQYWALVT